MSKTCCFLSLLSLAVLATPLRAQSKKIEATNLPDHPFQVDYPSGRQLSLHVRSGDVRVVGKGDNRISVRLDARDTERAREVKVFFERFADSAELRVSGGPKNNLQIIVEVPKNTGLFVRMPAGQLEISDITGDKDVQLHAGELILHVGDPADYAQVDASVTSGGLEAQPFHEDHGGLFRSFEKSGSGRYRLHAHVGAGDLTLR
ncbi:MAG: hypothetical protein HRJ53_03620 [Acidobacteria bacterium Pan2503]|uniref:Adhesin domain-containing protein n=1 Tax=Candidatus Acidiferrum panamense TaxID=2741543 RepID=A0A7V8NMI7_9BACT|nr:hypothetical protein [Candidatus Acidoferrum panamensis]